MSNKPVIALLAALLAAALWVVLKETALAIAVEVAIENFAHSIGMSRPQMITAATPYVLALGAASAVAWVSYSLGVRDRTRKSPLEIVYHPGNPRTVETRHTWPGTETRYYVGVLNRTTDKTVHDLEVTWDPTSFTRYIDDAVRRRDAGEDRHILHRSASIDPQETQFAYLVGLDDRVLSFADYSDDIFKHASHFTVRARGKDAKEATAEFEYSPFRFPKILRVR